VKESFSTINMEFMLETNLRTFVFNFLLFSHLLFNYSDGVGNKATG